MITLVAGDTGSPLIFTLKDASNQPMNLTGCTVLCRYVWHPSGPSLTLPATTEGSCFILDPLAGTAQYSWAVGELNAGKITGEIRVTDGNGIVTTSAITFTLEIRSAV